MKRFVCRWCNLDSAKELDKQQRAHPGVEDKKLEAKVRKYAFPIVGRTRLNKKVVICPACRGPVIKEKHADSNQGAGARARHHAPGGRQRRRASV